MDLLVYIEKRIHCKISIRQPVVHKQRQTDTHTIHNHISSQKSLPGGIKPHPPHPLHLPLNMTGRGLTEA